MKSFDRLSSVAFCTLALLLAAPAASAQTFADNFNDENADDWTIYDPIGVGIFSTAGGVYRIQAGAPENAASGPGRAGSVFDAASLVANFTISVDLVNWNANLQQTFGIMARATVGSEPYTSSGYFFSYSPDAGRGSASLSIELLQDDDVMAGNTIDLADLDPNHGYRMIFTGIGDTFTGRIYGLDNLDLALGTMNFSDGTYITGSVGLLVGDSSVDLPLGAELGPADATFDNFTVTAIPEPATSGLIAAMLGGVAAFYFRQRGHRKQAQAGVA